MMVKLGYLLAFAVLLAYAQETAPQGFELWSGASLTQLEGQLKTEAGTNAHHIATKRLADFPNDLFMLSRREADGIVERLSKINVRTHFDGRMRVSISK